MFGALGVKRGRHLPAAKTKHLCDFFWALFVLKVERANQVNLFLRRCFPALVCSLHARRRPSAIAGLVAFCVINPVDGHPVWSMPHVVQESLKRLSPPLTHNNPATAISLVR